MRCLFMQDKSNAFAFIALESPKTHFKNNMPLSFACPYFVIFSMDSILIKQLKVPHQSWRDTPSAKMIITYFSGVFNDYLLSTII